MIPRMETLKSLKNVPTAEKAPDQRLESLYTGQAKGEQINTRNILFTYEGRNIECETTYNVEFAPQYPGDKPTFELQSLNISDPKTGERVDVRAVLGAGVRTRVNFKREPNILEGYPIVDPIENISGLMTLLHEASHIHQFQENWYKTRAEWENAERSGRFKGPLHGALVFLVDHHVPLPKELKALKEILDNLLASIRRGEELRSEDLDAYYELDKGSLYSVVRAWEGEAPRLFDLVSERDANLRALQLLKKIGDELQVPMNADILGEAVSPEEKKQFDYRDGMTAKRLLVSWFDTYRKFSGTSGSLGKNFQDVQRSVEVYAEQLDPGIGARLEHYRSSNISD